RPSSDASGVSGNFVWAVDEVHMPNYLLPRDCPRVCFARSERTTQEDAVRFIGYSNAARIIAVEWNWLDRIRDAKLYLYQLPSDPFEVMDRGAGYHIATESVLPISITEVADLLRAISQRNVELRFRDNLWTLNDAVANSTLEFSMIRMRNAQLRTGGNGLD